VDRAAYSVAQIVSRRESPCPRRVDSLQLMSFITVASSNKKAARHPEAAFYLVHCKVLQHKNKLIKYLISN
jgi:hypothetical protein